MGALTGVAPICYVNPLQQALNSVPVYAPSIPPVTANLTSIAAALNAVRQALTIQNAGMVGFNNNGANTPVRPNILRPGGPGGGGGGGGGGRIPPSSFGVTNQVITPVKIYDSNDPTGETFVIVNQVTALSMGNKVTGQGWNWVQPGNLPGTGN